MAAPTTLVYRLAADGTTWKAPGRSSLTGAAPTYVTFSDFAGSNYAGLDYFNTNTSIVGDGIDRTIYEMVADTSTRASYVAGLGTNTNQCHLIRTGGLDGSHIQTGIEHHDFTLNGTDQGHLYNGLEVGYSTGASVHDVKIENIPGDDISPSGETFSLNMWHANSSMIDNVYLDGGAISATLLGINTVDTLTVSNTTCTNTRPVAGKSMPCASWNSKNITWDTCTFSNSERGINIENSFGGYHHFINCTFADIATEWQIVCQSGVWQPNNGSNASTVLTIEDPVWNFASQGPFKVLHYPTSQKPANIQLDSDIHLVLDGVDVSSDTSKLLLVTE